MNSLLAWEIEFNEARMRARTPNGNEMNSAVHKWPNENQMDFMHRIIPNERRMKDKEKRIFDSPVKSRHHRMHQCRTYSLDFIHFLRCRCRKIHRHGDRERQQGKIFAKCKSKINWNGSDVHHLLRDSLQFNQASYFRMHSIHIGAFNEEWDQIIVSLFGTANRINGKKSISITTTTKMTTKNMTAHDGWDFRATKKKEEKTNHWT